MVVKGDYIGAVRIFFCNFTPNNRNKHKIKAKYKMNFNKLLQSLFGNKSSKDMKLIQPLVEKVKAAYPEIKALSNDELRARTKQLQKYVQDSANEQKAKIAELKAKIEETPILSLIHI